jgi:hypothetical protein
LALLIRTVRASLLRACARIDCGFSNVISLESFHVGEVNYRRCRQRRDAVPGCHAATAACREGHLLPSGQLRRLPVPGLPALSRLLLL